jgi:hypothetical protein
MMVWECTSTRYVLFWIVVVPTSDPKDMFMFTMQSQANMGRLS